MTGPLDTDVKARRAAAIAAAAATKNEALIEELNFMISCGEGEHATLQAVGYLHKPDALKRQLCRLGQADLIPRVFEWDSWANERRNQYR